MIQFAHVTKQYEGEEHPVLQDFCEVIQTGEFVLLTGESGIGKSTCIRLLLKETEPTSGEIQVLDQKLGELSAKQLPLYRRKLGVVFQEYYLIPEQTVYKNVELARLIAGGTKKATGRSLPPYLVSLGLPISTIGFPESYPAERNKKSAWQGHW